VALRRGPRYERLPIKRGREAGQRDFLRGYPTISCSTSVVPMGGCACALQKGATWVYRASKLDLWDYEDELVEHDEFSQAMAGLKQMRTSSPSIWPSSFFIYGGALRAASLLRIPAP